MKDADLSTNPGGNYRVLDPTDIDNTPHDEFAAAVLEGLSGRPKRLSSQFFYDDAGSDYFAQIMDLPEYYLTRCEAEIIETHGPRLLSRFVDRPFNLVDLGAGDGKKTKLLLRHLVQAGADFDFVPIDISEGAMADLTSILGNEQPSVRVAGLVAEYATALRWLASHSDDRHNLVLFLGSNIGNFNRSQARSFLRRLWSALNPGDHVFIGFDLKKDIDLLLDAYNDAGGVTAKFNLNLLARINRDLGGHFDPSKFRFYATYDVFSGAMESYLVSREPQTVAIDALHSEFAFNAWEPVHTEYSYKYLESDITRLAQGAGYVIEDMFYDRNRWFCSTLLRVEKKLSIASRDAAS